MKNSPRRTSWAAFQNIPGLALAWGVLAVAACPGLAKATTYNYAGTGANVDYGTAADWNPATVPDLSNGNTAVIGNGTAVTFNGTLNGAGSDLIVGGGGTLEVSSGSWTQVTSGNWIDIGRGGGNGTLLVDGGTFNQGTAGNLNFENAGNKVIVSSGTLNVSSYTNGGLNGAAMTVSGGTVNTTTFTLGTGGAYTQSGGAVNYTGAFALNSGAFLMTGGTFAMSGEFDVQNGSSVTISGGTFTVGDIVAFNSGAGILNLTGGTLVIGNARFNGFYNVGGSSYVNFGQGAGVIDFASGMTGATIQGMISAGDFAYNGTVDTNLADFSIGTANGVQTLGLTASLIAAPEPSTYALLAAGLAILLLAPRRSRIAAPAVRLSA